MKKLFLSFSLLLTVSFTFASNEVEKISRFEIEETINSLELLTDVNLAIESFIQVNISISERNNSTEMPPDPMQCAERAFNIHRMFTDLGFSRSWASHWADIAYDACMTLFK